MQKPFAINDFIIDDQSSFLGPSRANSTIKSILEGGIGLPGAGAQLARRYGRWPVISGLQRPGNRLNLTTYFCKSTPALRYAQRGDLLKELNPELEIAAKLYAADQIAPEGLALAFGPWDTQVDDDGAWTVKDLFGNYEAVLTGAPRMEFGLLDRQRSVVVDESMTNSVKNPSFEVNVTDDWSLTNGARAQDTDRSFVGGASCKLTADAALNTTLQNGTALNVADGVSVAIQCRVWRDADITASITLRDTTTPAGQAIVSASATGEWELLEASWVNDTGGPVNIVIQIKNQEQDGLSNIWVDAVQLTTFRLAYTDGDMGDGYSWSGTAHNSTSAKTDSIFDLSDAVGVVSQKDILTFHMVMRAPRDATGGDWPHASSNRVFDIIGSGASHQLWLEFDPAANRFEVLVNGSVILQRVQTFLAGDWLTIAITFDFANNDYRLYIDGVQEDSDSTALTAPIFTNWRLGASNINTRHGGFWFAEYDVYDRVLTAGEIAQLYTNQTSHARTRYLNVLCEASQPLVIDGAMTNRGNVSTLAIDGDVRWRSNDGDVNFWTAWDDAWPTRINVDTDDDVYPIIRITPDLAKDAGTGFQYKSPVLVEWKAPSSAENYPVVFTLDTSTLNGAGKIQGDLDDLRVYVDGLEADRWLDSTTPAASTNIWLNLDFSAHLEFDLKTAIAGAGAITEIELDDDEDLTALPASGLVLIDSEVFVYTGKNNFSRKLTGVTRAMRGTAAAAHTTTDVVKWIQHDVYVVYGDSSLPAPVTDDDFKPILNLSTSTNDSWVYADFGEDDKPRAAAWVSEILQDPRPFNDTSSLFAVAPVGDPWTDIDIDNELYLGDDPGSSFGPPATGKVGEARLKAGNVCGITNALFSALTGTAISFVPSSDIAMQSSEDGTTWTRETSLSTGLSPVNRALDAGGTDKWVAMWSYCTVAYGDSSGNINTASIRMGDATLTLYNTLTPDTTVQAEEVAYQVSAVLTNTTTDRALLINFIMDLDETLEIDTYNGVVTYLLDNTSQQQAVQQQDGARREWLPLRNGDNALQWADTGTNDLDLQFFWERRYWE